MPARQYLLQVLPIALQALDLFSEAQREGYVTVTRAAHAAVVSKGQGLPRCLYSPQQSLSKNPSPRSTASSHSWLRGDL